MCKIFDLMGNFCPKLGFIKKYSKYSDDNVQNIRFLRNQFYFWKPANILENDMDQWMEQFGEVMAIQIVDKTRSIFSELHSS